MKEILLLKRFTDAMEVVVGSIRKGHRSDLYVQVGKVLLLVVPECSGVLISTDTILKNNNIKNNLIFNLKFATPDLFSVTAFADGNYRFGAAADADEKHVTTAVENKQKR
ncbi:hypothetical protein EVAR_87040_1 [Eumeta japonica]|uniref:Uncharacterized protein n=1 Tax=Eumeta variegata TaxID=151549 RepID=A0A4C1Z411_EUMVA|nr:hypothetical protein EVAR_87040_1 [Eumeta japonica]